jgi:glycosyltransferase involved in cell wall biosynthesis
MVVLAHEHRGSLNFDGWTIDMLASPMEHSCIFRRMLRVLLDLRMVRGALHGIARYALELARRVPLLEPKWQFIGLTGPSGLPDDLGSLAPSIPLIKARAGFLSPLEQPTLVADLLSQRPDLFHATSYSVPALWPGKLVCTIHDANHLAVPENSTLMRSAYYRLVVAPRAARAEALITVSEFSRREIAAHLSIPPERLQVIGNGVDASFHVPTPSEVVDFRVRRGLPPRYFAAVGNPKAFKNLKMLLPIADGLPAPLVLLAGRGVRRALGFSEKVIELSPLSDDELVLFYAGACAVLVPSRYEGFGLPALEAMACGAPLLASAAGAHPEVVGDAGMLLPPDNPLAWREACLKVFHDEALRRTLAAAGVERASHASWDDCARQTLQVYRRALKSH